MDLSDLAARMHNSDALIFAFEGDDDKIVYGQWIRRIRSELRYEPFPCGGKKGVRDLKNAVTRDLSGLGARVFFFVDRDFDDLQDFLDASNVFMTETYSVENCLVTDEVVEGLLRDVPLAVIAAQLGHSDTRVVEKHYGHLSPGYVADTVRAAFGSLGLVEPSNVVLLAVTR